ncbi:MAG: hypothetical protein PVG30_00120 [Gammaproteobacteria bacterium]
MQILKFATAILLASCLTACASQNHRNYCENSQTIPRTVIPKGLSSAKIKDKYPVPSAKTATPCKPVSLIPPGTGTLP